MIAKIAVESAVYSIDRLYSYQIPEGMELRPGMRVSVPFGNGNRTSEGMVLSVGEDDTGGIKLKPVFEKLDAEPLLDAELLRLAGFLRERCFCTFYDAVKAILPAGVWIRADEQIFLKDTGWRNRYSSDSPEYPLLAVLEELGGSAPSAELRKLFGAGTADLLAALQHRGIVAGARELSTRNSDRTETLVSLAVAPEEALTEAAARKRRAPVQAEVLRMLAVSGTVSVKEVCYFTGAAADTLRRLEKAGLVQRSEREVFRPAFEMPAEQAQPVRLNAEQQAVYDDMSARFRAGDTQVSLLYGVTGSGKTAIYIRLIRDCLEAGKSAMLLVPEIALTPQLVALLAAHFGKWVAVLHSRLHAGARYDEWKRLRNGDARVCIGTRSAVFAPMKDLGLLIVDEEHEHSYKSENTPRYHARECAIWRGNVHHAPVILGSATPSIESMYRARTGVYRLYILRSRYNGMAVPKTVIVDMKEELREGNDTPLSLPLREALLSRGSHQAILFLNRRGSSRMLVCVDCGQVPECPNCSANLTYHQANGRLMCHYCGYSEPASMKCPECGGHRKEVGFGTQRVQEELRELLPGEEILRMDADTVTATNPHEKILSRFRDENIPVLVGTQMITKGLNFPNVTLVGVLDADAALYMESYRAAETAFGMITQVIGRSGRGSDAGKAFVQTMTPENPVVRLAAAQDYDGFYELELPMRQLRGCPPFADLAVVSFSGCEQEKTEQCALLLRDSLSNAFRQAGQDVLLLGPAPAPVAKVAGRYRYRLTLSMHSTKEIRRILAAELRGFLKAKETQGVSAFVDINPCE